MNKIQSFRTVAQLQSPAALAFNLGSISIIEPTRVASSFNRFLDYAWRAIVFPGLKLLVGWKVLLLLLFNLVHNITGTLFLSLNLWSNTIKYSFQFSLVMSDLLRVYWGRIYSIQNFTYRPGKE